MYFSNNKHFSKELLDSIEVSKNFPHSYIEYGNIIKEYFNSEENKNHINDTLEYGNWQEISLCPLNKLNIDLFEVHKNRISTRSFSSPMNLQDLSNLIQGAYHFIDNNRRNFPVGGGIYSIDVFFINLNIRELEKGVYVFNPRNNTLLKKPNPNNYLEQNFWEDVNKSFPIELDKHIDFKNSSGVIVFASMMNKLSAKYKDRGFRIGIIEVGALMQNFYLSASYFNIGCCAYYAYFDDNLGQFLTLNPPYELVSLSLIIGK